jgi:hypothetical protein
MPIKQQDFIRGVIFDVPNYYYDYEKDGAHSYRSRHHDMAACLAKSVQSRLFQIIENGQGLHGKRVLVRLEIIDGVEEKANAR